MLLLLPLVIGAFSVLQNVLNRRIAPSLGLDWALVVNGLVVFACASLLFAGVRFLDPETLPPIFRPVAGSRPLAAYDVVPGALGFLIIAGMPWAIERLGATRVFVGVIAAQLVVSLLWDYYVEDIRVSLFRVAGGALALAGTALATL